MNLKPKYYEKVIINNVCRYGIYSTHSGTICRYSFLRRLFTIAGKGINEDTASGNSPSCTPIKGPSIGLCSNTLYLFGQFNNIVLRLVDNDIAIYSMDTPAGANEVELPADMQGIYELQLDDGKYIYYCEIEIE